MLDVNSVLVGSVGLLIFLSIWTLVWIAIGKGGDTDKQPFVSPRLFWIYTAMIFTMLAITLSLAKIHFESLAEIKLRLLDTDLREFMYNLAYSCVLTAFIMVFINIVESAILAAIAVSKNKGFSDSVINNVMSGRNWFVMLAVCAVVIFIFALLSVIISQWFVIGNLATAILLISVSVVRRHG